MMARYVDYYDHNGSRILKQLRPPANALTTYYTKDNIVIGIFQGKYSPTPELDIRVKILLPKTDKPIQPNHTIWVVDLIIKISQGFSKPIGELMNFYLNFYDNTPAWQKVEERINYEPLTLNHIVDYFKEIDDDSTLSVEYIAIMIELFCRTEKLTPGAYWFRTLLVNIRAYAKKEISYIELLLSAQNGY